MGSNLLFSGSEIAATSPCSVLIFEKLNNFFHGTQCRINEHVLLQLNNGSSSLFKILLSFWLNLVVIMKGTAYSQLVDQAIPGSHLVMQTSNTVLSYASQISRKVMLYL